MDDRGCLAQSLKWIARLPARLGIRRAWRQPDINAMRPRSRVVRFMHRWSSFLESRWPRGAGIAASGLVILAGVAYGTIKGDHIPDIMAGLRDARDGIANAAGFRVASIALARNHHVSRDDVLATAGISGNNALLFFDVDEVRQSLITQPLVSARYVPQHFPPQT